jgi:hypothetical protein
MGFDATKFAQAPLSQRTEDVPVADLAAWFGEGEPAVWRVRGLNANEVQRAASAKERLGREAAMLDAITAGSRAEMAEELARILGRHHEDVEPETARRMEILIAGSVDPECTLEIAGRLAEHFPITFITLTNKILALTGQGSEVEKKPSSSGAITASNVP